MYLSQEQIQIIKDYFADKPVKKVYVFGSYARGEADENSDIDLYLVLNEEKKKLNYFELAGIWDEVQGRINKSVDIVHEHRFLKEKFLDRINNDKILLFEQ